MSLLRLSRLPSVLLVCICCGCGDSSETAVNERTPAGNESRDDADKNTDGGDGKGAEEAARNVLSAVGENRPEVVWNALPESWRKDVNGLLHRFAGKMDPEVWNRGRGLLQKAVDVARRKRRFITKHPLLDRDDEADQKIVETRVNETLELLDGLLSDEAADLDSLKTADAGEILESAGGRLLEQLDRYREDEPGAGSFKNVLSKMAVSTVSKSEDSAVLKFKAPGQPASTQEYVRVENKWVPKYAADNWTAWMKQAGETIDGFGTEGAEKKETLEFFDRAEAALDRLDKAETLEDFGLVFESEIVQPVARWQQARMLKQRGGTSVPTPDTVPTGSVKVVIAADLDQPTDELLQDLLREASDDADLGVAISSRTGGNTVFEVSPVGDVRAFADRLRFAKVLEVDEKTGVIKLEVSADPPGGDGGG